MTSNTVAVELSGGLGNQLFQYAAGLALARRHGAQLILDGSLFRLRSEPRRLALAPFALEVKVGAGTVRFSPDGKDAFITVADTPAGSQSARLAVVREASFDHDPRFAELGSNVFLRGYWQSYHYFEHLSSDLRKMIHIDADAMDLRNRNILDGIKAGSSVAVHVRRGDYLLEPYRSRIGVCNVDYYRMAMAELRKQVPGCTFYIFSDDIPWCRISLAAGDTVLVAHNDPSQAHIDLMLMAACRHHIISNSSLSWWAAYLGERPGAMVIAPVPWFRDQSEVQGRFRPRWELRSRASGEPLNLVKERVARIRVSVIVPAHDRPAMLKEAIESVLDQTKPASEIIIVLSKASPECTALARDLARHKGCKVVAITEANVASARNAGIKAATGDWIAFLDDDDIWMREKMERQLQVALLLDVGVVSCDFILFNEDGDIAGSGLSAKPDQLSLAEALMIANFVSGGSAAIVRADILGRVDGFDEQLPSSEDTDMWRRIAQHNEIVVLLDKLLRIRRHEGNASSNSELMKAAQRRQFTKMCADAPRELRHMLFPVGLFYWYKGWGLEVGKFIYTLPAFLAKPSIALKFTRITARSAIKKGLGLA